MNIWNHSGQLDGKLILVQKTNWVTHIGFWDEHPFIITLTQGGTVRSWGATKGIGQLQASGPTKTTVLDHAAEILIHEDKIIGVWPIRAAEADRAWRQLLKIN